MKHHWRCFYRDTVRNTNSRYLFSSIRIHYASECIIGGVAIDPVLNLIVGFLFSGEPGGSGREAGRGGGEKKKKKRDQNVMVTTCSTVKGSFIDQDRQRSGWRRRRRRGKWRYFCKDPNCLTFQKSRPFCFVTRYCCSQRARMSWRRQFEPWPQVEPQLAASVYHAVRFFLSFFIIRRAAFVL